MVSPSPTEARETGPLGGGVAATGLGVLRRGAGAGNEALELLAVAA